MPHSLFIISVITCLVVTFMSSASFSIAQELAPKTSTKHSLSKPPQSDLGSGAKNNEPIDPIDKQENDCLDKASSTAEMIACADAAYRAWDKELNRLYSQLMKELPTTSRQLLKDSQLEWMKYRDKEFSTIADIYSHVQGSMFRPVCVDDHAKIVKARVLQLKTYLDLPIDQNR